VKAVLASRRITIEDKDIDAILEIVRQEIGFE
jgi:DNA-directed RNA polymerase subunit F